MAALTKPSSPDTPKKTNTATVAMEAIKSATTTNNDIALASKSAPSESLKSEGAPSSSHAPSFSNTTTSTSNNTNTMPTYLTTKSSKAYTLSKQLLASGSLDDALSTLEMALQLSRDMLTNAFNNTNNNNDKKDDDDGVNIELHEGLAPLYYLYGTTLLYSVEESDVMMANDQTKINGAAATADIDVPPEDEKVGAEQPVNGGYGEEEDGGNEVQEVSDPTEDLQIAWENLDLARSIVTRLVEDFKPNSNTDGAITIKSNNLKSDESDINNLPINNGVVYTKAEQTDLLLDLAQIHTRLGDLQRANANILPCIDDYTLALDLRTQTLGKFDKKVADSHFSLAQVYAEAPNQVAENEGKVSDFVNSLGGPGAASGGSGGGGDVELTEEEKIDMRRKSLEHYLACGVAFVGVMAKLCGEDAEVLTSANDESCAACALDSAAMAASASSAQSSTNYAKTMSTLRQRITSLPQTKLTQDTKLEFDDLKELLDEIQEAMDSAEETEEGLKSLGQMKANEIKKHEMKQNGESVVEKSEDGAMTTIGFGAPSSSSLTGGINAFGSSGAASAATAFGSTTSTTSATAAPTMMVVKKKKKKAVVQPVTDGDSTTKRLKTSE